MNNKKIVIRCITDEKKGFGNLSRSILLGTYLKSKKIQVIFLINNSKNAILKLKKFGFNYKVLPKNLKISQEHIFINKFLLSLNINFLIIDMREYSEKLSHNLEKNNFSILVLDDAWCKIVYSNYLINSTPIIQYQKYKKIKNSTKLFLGPKYWIIQKNFSNYIKSIYDIKLKKKYNVTITMGGSDPTNITKNILESIINLKNIKINIIFGPFFNKLEMKKMKLKYPKLKYYYDLKNPLIIFQKSDLVISSSGNTLFELAILGIPTICIPLVEHQTKYSQFFAKKGFCINLGKWNNKKSLKLKEKTSMILNDVNIRRQMSQVGKKFCDGKGGIRISSEINDILRSNINKKSK